MAISDFHCRTCSFHSAGFCLKRYSTTGDYETCDEYDCIKDTDKKQTENETC